ncbi:MAG: hypothetical protein JKY66_06015 [Spongiibacteraceae bacterium]|nr:hypothetical protein [Spongiibacteraceae bacterium]
MLNNETTPLTEKPQSSQKNTDASYRTHSTRDAHGAGSGVNPSPLAAELAAQPQSLV